MFHTNTLYERKYMKKRKIINIILLILILLNTCKCNVQAVALKPMEEVYIEDLGECERHIQYYKESENIWSYIITNMVGYRIDGKLHYAYCMQQDRKGVGGEQEGYNVNVSEMLKNPKIWRAIINGFPYKSAEELDVKNDEDAFVATKQAIYCVMYGWNVDYRYVGVDDEGWRIVDAIRRIVNSAINGTDTPDKTNILSISRVGEFKKESEQYYSQEFKVDSCVKVDDYEITEIKGFPEGSFSTDIYNNQKEIFENGENFKILVPKENIIQNFEGTIKIDGKAETYPIFYGKSYDEKHQDYALTYDSYENISAEISMKIDAYKSKLTIYKVDSETNKPIEDVEFNIKYEDGSEIGNYKTDSKGIITISNLKQGKVIITETKTQEKYVLDENVMDFVIEYDTESILEIRNDRKKGNIKITKVSEDDNLITGESAGTPIANVKFEIYDKLGKLVDIITTKTDGIAISKDLSVGKYIIKEKETGEYYEINSNDFEVEITKNGEVVDLKISNKSKTPPTEENPEDNPPQEIIKIEEPKKLPITGF